MATRTYVAKSPINHDGKFIPVEGKLEMDEKNAASLVEAGVIVIAGGGGGIPCYLDEKGHLEGVDAVIDKDRCSALLANQLGAKELMILTGVRRVAVDFGKESQRELDRLTVAEARRGLAEGQFPAGSMGPKIESAIQFIEGGGERCVITDFSGVEDALHGRGGTWITR